ncbi:hypothetical protein [Kutzneria sp. NPDC052558]
MDDYDLDIRLGVADPWAEDPATKRPRQPPTPPAPPTPPRGIPTTEHC